MWVEPKRNSLPSASDDVDARASLSASECTLRATEGAAEHKRVLGGRVLGASWLEGPVVGDNANDAVELDIATVVRVLLTVFCGRQQRNLW